MKNMPRWPRQLFKLPSLLTTGKYIADKRTVDLDFDEPYRDRLWRQIDEMLGRF